MALELSCFERMALASSLADFEVMSALISDAASAEPISEVWPAAAAAPASAAVLRKSRRPILSLMCDPISKQTSAVTQLILFFAGMQVC
jgi:hypothetical protein